MISQRHQLIFPKFNVEFVIHSIHENSQELKQYISSWFNQGLPGIYARQSGEDCDHLNLGLPVLLAKKKYRVGLFLPKNAVCIKEELPKLVDMKFFWAKKLGQLPDVLFSTQELIDFKCVSVFGSYLFEYLSEQPFVEECSDLDILIDYEQNSLNELELLSYKLRKKFNRAIDGEVRFNNVGDIAINELLNTTTEQLLFKNANKVGLITRHGLYEQYPDLRE